MEPKIFDTLIHSGLSVIWPTRPQINISVSSILKMIDNEMILKGALVQTSPWFDSADSLELFYKNIVGHKGTKTIIPVATIPVTSLSKLKSFLNKAIDIGFTVFKIHPRFSNHSLDEVSLILDLVLPKAKLVQVCTYEHKTIDYNPTKQEKHNLLELLAYKSNLYSTNIMLMHAFDVSLLQAHNIVRHNKFLILDLSMTLLKYDGSSVDNDIGFLFKNFENRITIGSDYPEWSYKRLEEKLLKLSVEMPEEKLKKIYYKNVENILCK